MANEQACRDDAPAAVAVAIDPPEGEPISIVNEFVWFIRENKKWWLVPLIVIFLFLALVIVVGSNPALGPAIYSLL